MPPPPPPPNAHHMTARGGAVAGGASSKPTSTVHGGQTAPPSTNEVSPLLGQTNTAPPPGAGAATDAAGAIPLAAGVAASAAAGAPGHPPALDGAAPQLESSSNENSEAAILLLRTNTTNPLLLAEKVLGPRPTSKEKSKLNAWNYKYKKLMKTGYEEVRKELQNNRRHQTRIRDKMAKEERLLEEQGKTMDPKDKKRYHEMLNDLEVKKKELEERRKEINNNEKVWQRECRELRKMQLWQPKTPWDVAQQALEQGGTQGGDGDGGKKEGAVDVNMIVVPSDQATAQAATDEKKGADSADNSEQGNSDDKEKKGRKRRALPTSSTSTRRSPLDRDKSTETVEV